jgi:hypothetical protein
MQQRTLCNAEARAARSLPDRSPIQPLIRVDHCNPEVIAGSVSRNALVFSRRRNPELSAIQKKSTAMTEGPLGACQLGVVRHSTATARCLRRIFAGVPTSAISVDSDSLYAHSGANASQAGSLEKRNKKVAFPGRPALICNPEVAYDK